MRNEKPRPVKRPKIRKAIAGNVVELKPEKLASIETPVDIMPTPIRIILDFLVAEVKNVDTNTPHAIPATSNCRGPGEKPRFLKISENRAARMIRMEKILV